MPHCYLLTSLQAGRYPSSQASPPRGIGVNLRRKIMDLIIKFPSFPLFQRGMFYDSPLSPFTKGGCFMISLFGKEG